MEATARNVDVVPLEIVFEDGLGPRYLIIGPSGDVTAEALAFRPSLSAVRSFEFALRERVARLGSFSHPAFAHVRGVDRTTGREPSLRMVSDAVVGTRVSRLIERAQTLGVSLDTHAALCITRQVVAAIAALHERARDLAHGAIATERLVVTPEGRVVVVEHGAGAALQQLRFTRKAYWSDLRVALPAATGPVLFDQRVDVTQLGVVALGLILGRPLEDVELPNRFSELVGTARAISPRGDVEPLPSGLRGWLNRALQLDPLRSFASALDARADLDAILGDTDDLASLNSLEGFLDRVDPPLPYTVVARRHEPDPGSDLYAPTDSDADSDLDSDPAPQPEPERAARRDVSLADIDAVLVRSFGEPTTTEPTAPEGKTVAVLPSAEPPTTTNGGIDLEVAASPAPEPPQILRVDAASEMPDVSDVPDVDVPDVDVPDVSGVSDRAFVAHAPAVTGAPDRSHIPERAHMPDVPHVPDAADAPYVPSAPYVPDPADLTGTANEARVEPLPDEASAPTFSAQTKRGVAAGLASAVVAAMAGYIAASRAPITPPRVLTPGALELSTGPAGVDAFVDGNFRGLTPLTVALAPGPHTIELHLSAADWQHIPINISAGMKISQFVQLPRAAGFGGEDALLHAVNNASALDSGAQPIAGRLVDVGSVSIVSDAMLRIFEGGVSIGSSRDRLELPVGRHALTLVDETSGINATRVVTVDAKKPTVLKVAMPTGVLAVNTTPPAEVWVDGDKRGETPLGNLTLRAGAHDILFRHPEFGDRRRAVVVTAGDLVRLSVDLRVR